MKPMKTPLDRRVLIRFVTIGGLLVMAAITGVVSYQHGYTVVNWVGNTRIADILVPLMPDLDILVSYVVALEAAIEGQPKPKLAISALWGGIVVTVAMNVGGAWLGADRSGAATSIQALNEAAGYGHLSTIKGIAGAGIGMLAPLALIVALHILIGRGYRHPEAEDAPGAPDPQETHAVPLTRCAHGKISSDADAARMIYSHMKDCIGEPISQRNVAAMFKSAKNRLFGAGADGRRPEGSEEESPAESPNGSGPQRTTEPAGAAT